MLPDCSHRLNALVFRLLARRARPMGDVARFDAGLRRRMWRVCAASAVMGVVLWLISAFGTPLFGLAGWRWLALLAMIAGGVATYLAA